MTSISDQTDTGYPRLSCAPASDDSLITVVMAAFNAAATIRESVRSVLDQTHSCIELIVVDDGSSDQTVSIVEELISSNAGAIRLLAQQHKGPYPARNLAIRASRGRYIAFLDADDTWRPDCLARLYTALEQHDADLAYCGWQNVGPAAPGSEPFIPPAYEAEDIVVAALRSCPWPIHAALSRRSAIEAVGGFSERMFTSMDYDLWIRLIAHTRRIVRVPEVMAFYHWRGGQISSDRSRQVLDAVQVRRDFVKSNPALLANVPKASLIELIDGQLGARAYEALWRRQLRTAQKLFRAYFSSMQWKLKDLPYVLCSLLPSGVFDWVVTRKDS
jgi:cellulose synthase/poly-beta-1,6-N-acetylglucosamine synthase-like glycosyltransferase